MPLLPTPWPADPVEGEPGHFDHTLWVKAGLIALDNGKIDKPAASVPAGKLLATTATDTWSAVDPASVGGVPSGVIVMWTGTTPPAGWVICNGANGTPNLQDKFILGSGSRTPGSSGGEESVLLTGAQSGLPAHTHTEQNASASHTHTFKKNLFRHNHTMQSAGEHTHGVEVYRTTRYGASGSWQYDLVAVGGGQPYGSTTPNGGHWHVLGEAFAVSDSELFTTDASSSAHSHTINANAAANASQAHNNMPPYYVLAFIMKL